MENTMLILLVCTERQQVVQCTRSVHSVDWFHSWNDRNGNLLSLSSSLQVEESLDIDIFSIETTRASKTEGTAAAEQTEE